MYLLGKITVMSVLPEKIIRLKDIARNLWWSWNSEAIDLYRDIDLSLWERLGKNPIRFLQEVSQKNLEKNMNDPEFMNKYDEVVKRFDNYMSNTDTWYNRTYPDKKDEMVAYFSAEYGLHEVLPIYSGGLGVLSGDHCKAASDLGLPFTAIGIFYKQGYFNQRISHEGWQETKFTDLNVSHLPIESVLDSNNEQIYINVELPGRVVYAKIWLVRVGRISLYLIDTDVEQNNPNDRLLTSRLYGGDQETRIQQEIFLGIGGIRVLDALGIKATAYHMNEGHSAFLGLELMRKMIQQQGLSFRSAKEACFPTITFTTHTPVPAGNDVFPIQMVDRYFSSYWDSLRISRHEFLDLGLKVEDNQNFNMTVLAMSLAGRRNGVSELHGAVSRKIFNSVWPGVPENEVPISHITNGIHTLTWLSPNFKYMYNKYLDHYWQENLFDINLWKKIDEIPDDEIWNTHCMLKNKMFMFIRDRLKEQRLQNGEPTENIRDAETIFDPDALTLGFARRFATYKRANLIFRDISRIQKILNNPTMPVQIIFAGKAHPADGPAQEVIKNISDIAKQEGFKGKVIVIENYNMTLARNMVQGVDIWLNNPKRPLEASGTSGQKASINGVINFSILDGWWCEGYNGKNGWAIGDDTYYGNEYNQDNADSESLYEILEKQIIPAFYNRNEKGTPSKWVAVMKESIKTLVAPYSTHRMVQDYINEMYIPSMIKTKRLIADKYVFAKNISDWKQHMEKNWPKVYLTADKTMNMLRELNAISGENIDVSTLVDLGEIEPESVHVELYYGYIGKNNEIINPQTKVMDMAEKTDTTSYRYSTNINLLEGGEYGYTFRVVPYHPELINTFNVKLIRWVVQ